MAAAMELQDQGVSPSLIRLWSRRMTLAGEELDLGLLDDLYNQAEDIDESVAKSGRCSPCFQYHQVCESDLSDVELPEEAVAPRKLRGEVHLCLDGAMVRDVPARYTVPAPLEHEFLAVGVWLDPRIAPGFRYRVRPVQEQDQCNGLMKSSHFFGGRALTLQSIGRGYARRVTFQPDTDHLNDNANFFWTDSWPLGFAFELVVTAVGDKFTLLDANHIPAGTLEILENMASQEEMSHVVLPGGSVEKTVKLRILCKVEWFDGRNAEVAPVSGVAMVVKPRGESAASVSRVTKVSIGAQKRGYILTPGVNDKCRRVTVRGRAIGDIPTQYTVTGLDAYEMPVIGTYVDPRILPGFHYRVRPAGSKRHLFDGRPLKLASIGAGYGKRLTFAPDENALNTPTNYFWSDSYPDGLGFEPRAVMVGMKFEIFTGGQNIGEATVFRTDLPQVEVKQEVVRDEEGRATAVKHILVDVTCHVRLRTETREHAEDMRVSGTAVAERGPGQPCAVLRRVQDIGLDSQLNVLFLARQAELVFLPL
ncbi:uncharacterized protein LOC134540543 [Bacillus rossius redtenbacheri]|uniref:uncharacterized protein LOC134540543 n=1 Tax=Bacillus rossius redtenbacheri TaxID=93214 RepID=UPI002FDDAD80